MGGWRFKKFSSTAPQMMVEVDFGAGFISYPIVPFTSSRPRMANLLFLSVPAFLNKGGTSRGRKKLTEEIESTIVKSLMLLYRHYFLCRIAWQIA
jgi:hypothetical protein